MLRGSFHIFALSSHCNLSLPVEVDEVERLCLGRCALLPATRGDVVELARKEEDALLRDFSTETSSQA